MKTTKETTLVLYPNAIGMGYIICEGAKEILDFGMTRIQPRTRSQYIKRLRSYLRYFQPETIVVRGIELQKKSMGLRTKQIIRSIIDEAKNRDIRVEMYSREDIKRTFYPYGKTTKFAINTLISTWYPELKPRQPQVRQNYQSEHYQTGMFDAFAIMLTHFDEK